MSSCLHPCMRLQQLRPPLSRLRLRLLRLRVLVLVLLQFVSYNSAEASFLIRPSSFINNHNHNINTSNEHDKNKNKYDSHDTLILIRGGSSSSSSTANKGDNDIDNDDDNDNDNDDDDNGSTIQITPRKKISKNKRKNKKNKDSNKITIKQQQQKDDKKITNGNKKDTNTINTTINTRPGKKSKTSNRKKPKASSSSSSSSKIARGGKQGECLRRIKHEWKDVVKLGIGYDWITKQTITTKGKSPTGQNEINNDDHYDNYNYIRIGPFQNNLKHWHFSIKGPSHSVYSNGIYHGRIILPNDYPGSPPRVQMLTPSGRFVSGTDICLSASSYHPETWTPRWTILSLVDALRIHMLTMANEIGGLHTSDEQREKFALFSRSWKAGCINHERMVKDGLFASVPPIRIVPSEEVEEVEVVVPSESVSIQHNDTLIVDQNTNENVFNTQKDETMSLYQEEDREKINNDNDNENDSKTMMNHGENNTIDKTIAYISAEKETKSTQSTQSKQAQQTQQTQQQTVPPASKRKRRIVVQRRPEKQKVIVIILRGIIEFFQRHLELGIICAFIIFFLK